MHLMVGSLTGKEIELGGHSCSCFRYMKIGLCGHLSQCSDGLGYHSGTDDMEGEETKIETVGEEWEVK